MALIFEKTSTRTRGAFEVAAYDQGAHVTYLDPAGSQMGHKESVKDTARVLGRMYDGIEFRGRSQEAVETLAAYSGVPVWNGLTDEFHPTQVLADFLTMLEHSAKPLEQISYCYLGDARNNMGNSLMVGGCKLGMDVRLCAPGQPVAGGGPGGRLPRASPLRPGRASPSPRACSRAWPGSTSSTPTCGSRWGRTRRCGTSGSALLRPYQVNMDVVRLTGNPAVKFLHCLPAFHDRETKVGEDIYRRFGLDGLEVTDEVFESEYSIVWDQAENRMHTIKAVMVATIGS